MALKAKARKNGRYYAVGTVRGKRIRQSLGTRDKSKADELCAQLGERLWKRSVYGEEAVRTFEEAAVSYLEDHPAARFTNPLVQHFRGRLIGTIKPGEIQKAARKLYPHGKGSTRNRQAVVPARAIINHAAGLGWCQKISVDLFPTEVPLRRVADRAWVDAFMARADRDNLQKLSAAVLFMWQGAARVSETARVLPEHIDLAGRVVSLERTKTGEWELAHITHELMIRLANLPMTPGWPVFGYADRFGITNRMKAVCRRAGIEYLNPHVLRHSYASNSFAMGATVPEVMRGGRYKTARLLLEVYSHADQGGRSIADRFDGTRGEQAVSQIEAHTSARSCIVLRDKETG